MIETPYIVDIKLPDSQDFDYLKQKGLDYIQLLAGNNWTNLNPSDPGVTILEQVCYALTELGYCNDFSVADILTAKNGKLHIKDQFYLPEEILTSSPVTINDYRKYIIDHCEDVLNVSIIPLQDEDGLHTGIYQVYLKINPGFSSQESVETSVYYLLQKVRNLGEQFLQPAVCCPCAFQLSGKVEISKDSNINTVMPAIQSAISEYVFPTVKSDSYNELISLGLDTDEILNGPKLQNGWILLNEKYDKKDSLSIYEINSIMNAVKGVTAVAGITIVNTASANISCTPDQLLTANLEKITFSQQGKSISTAGNSSPLPGAINMLPENINAAVNVQIPVPQGEYREIDTYYSIQNTFPDVYAVGRNTVESNASDFRIAQSRQLKGYLTLFDQVLANQFSQLANLDKIFSFKNAHSNSPVGKKDFYEKKNAYEKKHPEYPAPFLSFAPTYFFQPLYDIPDIRPLLRNNTTFDYSLGLISDKALELQSWEDYKNDPYNAYMNGLSASIDDQQSSIQRRNTILDHLLARHGMAPVLINTIIDGSVYSGDADQDKVIFKSLLLQNFGLLSYYKQKGYNCLAAGKLELLDGYKSIYPEHYLTNNYTNDFIFSSGFIDQSEKLSEIDFISFSTFELQAGLLLGLKPLYNFYITDQDNGQGYTYLLWLIEQRKGFLFIETDLLKASASKYEIAVGGTIGNQQIEIIFPEEITVFSEAAFQDRLALCASEFLPLYIDVNMNVAAKSDFEILIPAFVIWHNSLIYGLSADEDKVKNSISVLINWINAHQNSND